MNCTQIGLFNICKLIIHYNDPLVIIGWMIFAIIVWQTKGFIWSLIKWIFKLLIWLILLIVGLSIVSALIQTTFI